MDFDSELNVGYHQNVQDIQTSLVSDVAGGALATVVDAGASIWNSLPGTPEVSTADLLSGISDNALRVYEENPDLIHAASFIGASFVPGGLAVKGMNAMRNGSKAVSWFTKAGKEADIAKVTKMFQEGAAHTKEYRDAIRIGYAKTAVNQAIDAAAAEIAIIGTLNAAPLVEDYMKDPLTNFGISVAFGGVLGGAIGVAADHFALRQIVGGISESALTNTLARLEPTLPDMPNAIALQVAKTNIDMLGGMVETAKAAGKTADNDITAAYASKLLTIYTSQADELFQRIVSPEILALPVAQRDLIKQTLMNSPEMFGVEKVATVSQADLRTSGILKGPKGKLKDTPSLVDDTVPEFPEAVKAVFFQELGLYGTLADLKHFAGASALNKTGPEMALALGKNFGKVANYDASLELLTKSSAELQGDYIGYLLKVGGMTAKDMEKMEISKSDSAMLTAVIAKMKSDPDFKDFKIKIGDEGAYAKALIAEQAAKAADPVTMAKKEMAAAAKEVDDLDKEFAAAVDSGMDQMSSEFQAIQKKKDEAATAYTAKYTAHELVAKQTQIDDGTGIVTKSQSNKLGIPPDYQSKIDAFAGPEGIRHLSPKNYGKGISEEASQALTNWITTAEDGMQELRLGALEYFRGGAYTTKWSALDSPVAPGLAKQLKEEGVSSFKSIKSVDKARAYQRGSIFKEIYESDGSKELRRKFASLADDEGNVLLFRGSHDEPGNEMGRSTLKSYTPDISKAREFGNMSLFKVKVQDIAAGFVDGSKTELLVVEGIRAPKAALTTSGRVQFFEQQVSIGNSMNMPSVRAGLPELEAMLLESKKDAIDTMLASGIPIESIAIKTNTDQAIVLRYSLSDKTLDNLRNNVAEWEQAGGNAFGNIVNHVDDIDKVLDPTKQPLVLSGNMRKNQYAEAYAGLDNRTMTNINAEVTAGTMFASRNSAVQQLGSFLFSPGNEEGSVRYVLDMLKAELSKGNNELSGNAFFNSFDFFSRNMGSLGPQISYVGKKIQKISNDYIQKINKPIAEAMSKVSANVADTVEFNTFREVNAGLAGWRKFDPATGHILQKVQTVDEAGKKVTKLEPVKYQGKEYTVVTDSVKKAVMEIQNQSPELLSLINTNRKIQGLNDVNDIGLWIPSFNPVNKFIAYVHDTGTDTTQILWANTKAEYEQVVRGYKAKLVANGQDKLIRVIEKGVEQQEWSRLNGRMDTMLMKVADSSDKKSGSSASALVRSDTQVFGEIAGGYEHFINSQMRTLADLSMSDITGMLDKMSLLNQGSIKSQPLTGVKKFMEQPKDTAAILKNTLLGDPNLGEYAGWQSLNQSFETGLSFASSAVAKTWDVATRPFSRTWLGGKKTVDAEALAKMDYENLAKELESKGIVNPWAGYDKEAASMFGLSRLEDSPDTSKRIIYASNALAATVALRIGELAQPLVNIMSLPILTGLAAASKMPETFMGIQKGTAKVSGTQIIFEGARAANSPQFAHFDRMWTALGYFEPLVSEANQTLQAARSMNRGAISQIEKALDSRMVEIMSKPADWSETFVRRQTMFTGAVLAKRLYPELSDEGVTIFARDFMDKAVGNFHASQRPVFFQGTLGVALGLFQTYSLTLGQNIYRQLEMKNYKALGKAALTQSGIFGVGSMPGFNGISQAIGEHFSDDNVDLQTGTYRALPDGMANAILYGLPSMAGTGVHTRGDADFRFPGISGDNIVALNFAKQVSQAVSTIGQQMDVSSGNAGFGFMQALSLQNMSRPLARGAELATGYSITRAGNTVSVPEEVWTPVGVASRILGTRPLEEAKLRESMHLNTFYGSVDREARNGLMSKLRTGIRNGTLTDEQVAEASHEYMRKGGTPTGWRSAYATALGKTETSGREVFADKLKPDNPLNFMINNLD